MAMRGWLGRLYHVPEPVWKRAEGGLKVGGKAHEHSSRS
jgi:hypothetical protein